MKTETARGLLIPIDLSPANWICSFCGERVDITEDMLPPLHHKAFTCPLFPEAELSAAQTAYKQAAKLGRVERLLGAHLMKHHDDWNASFDPRSLPAWARN